jgi:hypothetical protein
MHQNIWLAIHVGHGLDNVAQFNISGDPSDARLRLRNHVEPHDGEIFNGKFIERVIAPESMRNEKQAALDVLAQFARVRGLGKALSVITFSHHVASLLLNAAHELNCHLQTVIVLHAKGEPGTCGEVTVHELDAEGFLLNDFPYGALHPDIDRFELANVGFSEVHDMYRERQELSRTNQQNQGKAGVTVSYVHNHPKS